MASIFVGEKRSSVEGVAVVVREDVRSYAAEEERPRRRRWPSAEEGHFGNDRSRFSNRFEAFDLRLFSLSSMTTTFRKFTPLV